MYSPTAQSCRELKSAVTEFQVFRRYFRSEPHYLEHKTKPDRKFGNKSWLVTRRCVECEKHVRWKGIRTYPLQNMVVVVAVTNKQQKGGLTGNNDSCCDTDCVRLSGEWTTNSSQWLEVILESHAVCHTKSAVLLFGHYTVCSQHVRCARVAVPVMFWFGFSFLFLTVVTLSINGHASFHGPTQFHRRLK